MGVLKITRKYPSGKKVSYLYIRYALNGKLKKEAVGKVGEVTKAVAQELLHQRKRQIRLGQLDMIGARIPTLKEFSVEYLAYVRDIVGKRSWKRDEQAISHLIRSFGGYKLSEIESNVIIDYQGKRLIEGLKPATINRELAVLKHLFNVAKQRQKFFGDNPVSKVNFLQENNQIERILSIEEEKRLMNSSPSHISPIIVTALNTGMRKSEILTLKWSNVDLENNLIIIEANNSKSKRKKIIPINTELKSLFLNQKLKTASSEYVFLTPKGEPYKREDSLKYSFKRACKTAGIEGLRFHDLRHTFASRGVESGCPLVAISKILGHSNIQTTMRYAHPDESLRDTVEKIGNFTKSVLQSVPQENL